MGQRSGLGEAEGGMLGALQEYEGHGMGLAGRRVKQEERLRAVAAQREGLDARVAAQELAAEQRLDALDAALQVCFLPFLFSPNSLGASSVHTRRQGPSTRLLHRRSCSPLHDGRRAPVCLERGWRPIVARQQPASGIKSNASPAPAPQAATIRVDACAAAKLCMDKPPSRHPVPYGYRTQPLTTPRYALVFTALKPQRTPRLRRCTTRPQTGCS